MNTLRLLAISAMSSWIISCGGSDSGTDIETTNSDSQTGDSLPVVSETPPEQAIEEMVIDPYNDLTLNFLLEVSVSVADLDGERYLTICRYNDELRQVIRTECMYRGPVTESGVETTLTMTSPDIHLVAEIWSFVDGYAPNQYFWQYEKGTVPQRFIVR